jgi:hypothetical protein
MFIFFSLCGEEYDANIGGIIKKTKSPYVNVMLIFYEDD